MSSVIFQNFSSDDYSAPESIFIPTCTFYSQREEKIKKGSSIKPPALMRA
jgi:hypothetical protein